MGIVKGAGIDHAASAHSDQTGGGGLIVQLLYALDHVAKIKTVAGRRWHARERYRTVSQDRKTLGTLRNLFLGKLVNVDPARDCA